MDISRLRELRLEGLTSDEIAAEFGCTRTAISQQYKNCNFTEEEKQKINILIQNKRRANVGHSLRKRRGEPGLPVADRETKLYLKKRISELSTQLIDCQRVLRESTKVTPFPPHVKSLQRGIAAEFFVKYQLTRHGYSFADPTSYSEALDLLVLGPSGSYYRCEIKSCSTGERLHPQRTKYCTKAGKSISTPYSSLDKIDFFIFVTLEYENIFIVPFEEVKGINLTCSPNGFGWQFKDNYSVFK